MDSHAGVGHMWKLFVTGVALCATAALPTAADCGSIPFTAPLQASQVITLQTDNSIFMKVLDPKTPDVKVDPLNVVVYEPGQRAIVLWNGEEEILLLSTEIRTSRPVSILEVIPLPAEPTVQLGDFEMFEKMQRLLVDKTMWRVASGRGIPGMQAPRDAARITFHRQMGAHDLSVIQALDDEAFVAWVMQFLMTKGATEADFSAEFVRIIDNYLARNIHWFVFDVIQTGDEVQHDVFGKGVVIESEPRGADERVTVAFAGVGIKHLMASMAPLEKVEKAG